MKRLIVIACLVALGVPSQASAAKRGAIGGPPTSSPVLRMELKVLRPSGPVIVIGRGRAAGTRIEILAFNSQTGLCVLVSRPKLLRIGDAQGLGCGGPLQPSSGQLELLEFGANWSKGHGWLYSDQWGTISPSVASVTVSMQLQGDPGPVPATVIYARPNDAILARLQQAQPINLFLAVAHGCALASQTKAAAFDASGAVIASFASPLPSAFDNCRLS
jgi:hypothetical protein